MCGLSAPGWRLRRHKDRSHHRPAYRSFFGGFAEFCVCGRSQDYDESSENGPLYPACLLNFEDVVEVVELLVGARLLTIIEAVLTVLTQEMCKFPFSVQIEGLTLYQS